MTAPGGRQQQIGGPAAAVGGRVDSVASAASVRRVTPCFTPGTQIATQRGEIPAQLLRVGDRVITRDNGMQEIRWVGLCQMHVQDFQANPHLHPVVIGQGRLGKGLPERDLIVSPDHRVLVANGRTSIFSAEPEVLVAAKHLGAIGARTVQSSGTIYIHFMFDRHEVVLSNGAWTESFQPQDRTLKGMGNAQRLEILELFPALKTPAGQKAYPAARKTLSFNASEGIER